MAEAALVYGVGCMCVHGVCVSGVAHTRCDRPTAFCHAVPCCAASQDQMAMQSIADYFQHPIPEVPWNNEDEFISVLNKAGLTDLTV